MKSLHEFKQDPSILEEKKSDYSKFDMLVRAGLANKAQLARLHKILDKMKEDRPVFNPTDRAILQNLFNKMVGIITDNKQIFQRTRQIVREDIDESVLATSDYKIGPSGRKVRAHRVKVGDVGYDKNNVEEDFDIDDVELIEEQLKGDPPFVLLLKRKAIRLYPNKTKIALYYNDKLKKYFSIPYSTDKNVDSVLQSEESYSEYNSVIFELYDIVETKKTKLVEFEDGSTKKVDYYTAEAITRVYSDLNEENKIKLEKMINTSPSHLVKAADFAFRKAT